MSSKTDENHGDFDSYDNDNSSMSLNRNLSIPANFKVSQKLRTNLGYEANNNLDSKVRKKSILNDQSSGNKQTMQRRHSERHFRISNKFVDINQDHNQIVEDDHNQEQISGAVDQINDNCKQTSDSSSLRASDSAFSQSQSTLESDEGDRLSGSSFSRSLDGLTKDSRRMILNSHRQSESLKKNNDRHLLIPFENSKRRDGFKMIWRNLSFRVPEKRFSQLNTYWRRYKESIVEEASSNANQMSDDVTDSSRSSRTSSIGSNHQVESSSSNNRASDIDGGIQDSCFTGVPRKIIFDNLHGCAESGKLTAILGPSGAGKTTLLNCLTVGLVKGVTGSILIEDQEPKTTMTTTVPMPPRSKRTFRKRLKLCIIPQKDYLFDKLTVMENLIFASRLKNTQPDFEHSANVQRVTNLLGLQSCLELKTGKLSGGQYKRVSIAQELLSKPDILILDEPTSGLDSLTCFRTVSVLCDLVNMSRAGLIKPLAIVMTIHQPQMKVFNLFHHVYIMSSIGDCIYEGRPDDLIDTVADCCKLLPPPDDLNPASFIIDLASQVYGICPMEKLTKLQRQNFIATHSSHRSSSSLQDEEDGNNNKELELDAKNGQLAIFIDNDKSQQQQQQQQRIEESSKYSTGSDIDRTQSDQLRDGLIISDCLKKCNNHDRCFWLHTMLLVNRLWVAMWRDPLLATTRITFHLLIPFVFYFIYSQKSGEANACPLVERELDIQTITSEENLHRLQIQHNELILTFENVSLFFLLLYSFSMCVLAITALSFPLNMQILLKETSNGWYSMSRFVMAKTLADLPMEIAMPMISVSIAYYLTGQPDSYMSWRMLTITAVMTLCSLISQTQGLLFGAYFMNNVQAAVFVSQASSLPWIMLSGFTTRVIELPKVLRWLSFGSIYRLGIESIVAARYGFGMCPCDKELVDDKPAKLVGISDQLRSVMRYYFDMYQDNDTNKTSETTSSDDIFQRLASTISRANTYGEEIISCQDVRPFIMSARGVDETTLPNFIMILVLILFVLKIMLFFIVRLKTRR